MIGYDQIRVTSPYRMKRIDHVEITWKPGEHGRMKLRGIVDDADHVGAVLEASLKDEIQVVESGEDGEEPIFKGLITDVQAVFTQGVYTLEIEALAGSYLLDVRRKRRSFQQADMDYPALIAAILADYPGHDVICEAGAGVPIGAPVIQYDETDWELLKRLASRFHTVLISDIWSVQPKFSFGIPKLKSRTLPSDTSYKAFKDLLAYQKAGGSGAGLHDTDFFGYEFESGSRYAIGEELRFKDKPMRVSEACGRMEAGQLKYTYRLSRLEGMYQPSLHNDKLTGISLEGKVLDVKGELVKLHLTIDKEQPKTSAHWFAFAPPTGSAMYCMPKAGTDASLYLPDDSCSNAKVLDCVRKNGDSCAKTGNPSNRYFGTEHGSEVELTPTAVNVAGGSKEPLKLSFDDASGVTITSHKKLTLNAGEDISLYTPKRIVIKATSQLMAKKLAAQSGFAIEGEYHFLSENVLAEGRDQTSYSPYNDEPQKGTPPPPPEPPPKKKFSWGGLLIAAVAVVAVVAVVALSVATFGAGAVLAGAAIGAVIGAVGAVASTAASDIAKGEFSGVGDYLFNALKGATVGAVCGAIFGPFGGLGGAGGSLLPQTGGQVAQKLGAMLFIGGVDNYTGYVASELMEGREPTLAGGMGAFKDGVLFGGIFAAAGPAVKWVKDGALSVGTKLYLKMDDLAQAASNLGKKYLQEAKSYIDGLSGISFGQRQPALVGIGSTPNIQLSKAEQGPKPYYSDTHENYKAYMKEMEDKAAKEATAVKSEGTGKDAPSKSPPNVETNFIIFNKSHKNAAPKPRGFGPNGGRLESHHGLQGEWAKENLAKYGYDYKEAPTVTLETGKIPGANKDHPHTELNNRQSERRDDRIAEGKGKWSSTLQEELTFIVEDFKALGFTRETIEKIMEQQYKMLDKLKVPYRRINLDEYF
ncbi:hypothetical protein [Paenibacillus chitinolyticus]|uniref:hypothetical protein n=1 Tax=Paenibacillus chitinolyticus TaxID=79263 RepID=UPI00362F0594